MSQTAHPAPVSPAAADTSAVHTSPAAPGPAGPPRLGRLTASAGVLSLAAVAVALAKVHLPAPPGDTEVHRVIPFAVAAAGLVTTAVAERARARVAAGGPASRWLGLFALSGVVTSLHALLLATLGYALVPTGGFVPLRPLAWAEDWFFVVADGLLAVLLLAVPLGRRSRPAAATAAVLGTMLALGALANMVTPRALSTPKGMPNPLGIAALEPLANAGILAFTLVLLVGALGALGRGAVVSFARDRARRPLGRRLLGAAAVNLAFFVAQAALTPDGAGVGAGVVVGILMIASTTAIALLATSAATDASSAPATTGAQLI